MKYGYSALILASFLVLLGAAPLGASFQFYPISTGEREAASCRVATGAGGEVLVAWAEADSIWTRCWSYGAVGPAVNHGRGALPDVAFAEGGYILAFVWQGTIVVREDSGSGWRDAALYAFALNVTLPRLTGWWKTPTDTGVFLCFQTAQGGVRFAERRFGVWQDAELVPAGSSWGAPCFAQALPVPDLGAWRPRAYAMQEEGLVYSERVGGVWQAPVALHPGQFVYGGEFAAACGIDEEQHVLSNGPQPTCPCNVIHYTHGGPIGAWSDPEDLTVEFDTYTWPQDPAIAADEAGRVHAVWFQQHYGFNMMPTWKGLFYMVREGDVWTDYSQSFCCQRGRDADMDLRYKISPAIVFTQDFDAPSQVVLALDPTVTATESVPAPPVALSAQPNPFNPKTTLRFTLAARATVELSVCDVSGRRLFTVFAGTLPAGEQHFDWDGRDAAGREQPSGVYLAHLEGSGLAATAKLILLR